MTCIISWRLSALTISLYLHLSKQALAQPTVTLSLRIQYNSKKKQKRERKNPCRVILLLEGSVPGTPAIFLMLPLNKRIKQRKKIKPAPPPSHPAARCHKCDSTQHVSRECNFNGECTWCGRMGHKEQVCSHKKAGRTQAHLAHADGDDIQANMLTVKEKNHKHANNNITMSTRKGKGKRTFKLANPTISMSIGEEKSTSKRTN